MSLVFEDIIYRSLDEIQAVLLNNGYSIENDERADKLQLISIYRQDNVLTFTDTIYATSPFFAALYGMDRSDLLRFAGEQNLQEYLEQRFELHSQLHGELPSNIDIIRLIIREVDPYVIMRLTNMRIRCAEVVNGNYIDQLTRNRITPYRMVTIPTLGSSRANCYDIVSINNFWEEQAVFTDPANGRIVPPAMVDRLLNNNNGWESAISTDLQAAERLDEINPYDANPYRSLYQRLYQEIVENIKERIENGESVDHFIFTYIRDARIVKLLLDNGVDPNSTDEGYPVIMEAGDLNHVNIVKLLLDYGADPNRTDNHGNTILMIDSPGRGSPHMVSLLLNNGANPNIVNNEGDTALILATKLKVFESIVLLIEAGADIHYRDSLGNTMLFYLSYDDNDENVSDLYHRLIGDENILINRGVNLHHVNNEGKTALFTVSARITIFLLENGVDVNHTDVHGRNALFYTSDLDKAKILIESGINIHHTDNEDKNVLFDTDSLALSLWLIEMGIDINHRDRGGKNILFYVSDIELANVLVEHNIDINNADNYGNTALFYSEIPYIVELLIVNGIDINHVNNSERSALFNVVDLEIAKILIDNGADVNQPDHEGNTPLFNQYNPDIAKYLVEHGAYTNHVNNKGQTPLFTVGSRVTEYLISKGVDIHHVDNEGSTALFNVINAAQATILIENGIDVNHVNNKGQTALFTITTDRGNDIPYNTGEIIEVLLKNNIHTDQVDNEGTTAVQNMKRLGDIMKIPDYEVQLPPDTLDLIDHNQELVNDFKSYVESLELEDTSAEVWSSMNPFVLDEEIKPAPSKLYQELRDHYSWNFARWAIYNSKIILNCCRNVKKYTHKYDRLINKQIRSHQKHWSEDNYQVVEDLYQALNETTPLTEDITVYRGVKSYGDMKFVNFPVGSIMNMNGFTSFTLDIKVAELFAEGSVDNFVLKTTFPAGRKGLFLDVNFYTGHWEEKEILTYPNLQFRVVSKNDMVYVDQDAYRIIEAEMVGFGDPDIESIR